MLESYHNYGFDKGSKCHRGELCSRFSKGPFLITGKRISKAPSSLVSSPESLTKSSLGLASFISFTLAHLRCGKTLSETNFHWQNMQHSTGLVTQMQQEIHQF